MNTPVKLFRLTAWTQVKNKNLPLSTRYSKMACPNAWDGRFVRWFIIYSQTVTFRHPLRVNLFLQQNIFAIEFSIRHSRWKHHTRFSMVRTMTYLTPRSLEPRPSFTSRHQPELGARPGKGWCAVSAKRRVTPIACGTPGSKLLLNQPEETLLDEGDKKYYQSIMGAVKFPATTSSLPLTSWQGQCPTLQKLTWERPSTYLATWPRM